MAEGKIVRRLKVTVNEDEHIQVEQDFSARLLRDRRIKDREIQINLDDLKRETIQVLVNMLRENRLKTDEEFEVLGSNLYSVLFENIIGEEITAAIYEDASLDFLRIELEFDEKLPLLASWPWEYLYCPIRRAMYGEGYFLGRHNKIVLTRCLRLQYQKPYSLKIEERPVRVLFIAASPEREGLHYVQYSSVLNAIKNLQPVQDGLIEVTELVDPELYPGQARTKDVPSKTTYESFLNVVAGINPHIIHFIGHGQLEGRGGRGQIFFTKEDYTHDPVRDTDLATDLSSADQLRLVFLQACESALPDPYQAVSGVAMQLAQKYIPVVVAMQYKVQSQIANSFARAFYQAIIDYKTVDVAVKEGRSTLTAHFREPGQGFAFGLPVLYLREPGALFVRDVTSEQGSVKGSQAPGIIQQVTQVATVVQSQLTADTLACPWCGASNDVDDENCGYCGGPLVCPDPDCRKPVKRATELCTRCRKPLPQPVRKKQNIADTFNRIGV